MHMPDKDPALREKQRKPLCFAGIGTVIPPLAAGVDAAPVQFSIALSIGLAPLSILCLIFDQTKDLFRRWAALHHRHPDIDVAAKRGNRLGHGAAGVDHRAAMGQPGLDRHRGR